MMVTETKKSTSVSGDTSPIADRFWKTLSGTLKSVGSDDRLRAAINAMVGEESLKNIKNHLVPTEIVSSLKGSLDLFLESFKVELLSLLRDRLDGVTAQVDIKKEILKLLAENRIELHATISLIAKDSKGDELKIQSEVSMEEKPREIASSGKTTNRKPSSKAPSRKRKPSSKAKGAPKKPDSPSKKEKQPPKKKSRAGIQKNRPK